jgi:hypothetical protein
MTPEVTYGELLTQAARRLVPLHTATSLPFRDAADASATLRAWQDTVLSMARHATLLAPHDRYVRELADVATRHLSSRSPGPAPVCLPQHPAGIALQQARELMGAGHDVLATHLGPERQHRTSDATLLDSVQHTMPALHRVADMTLTIAIAHHALASRADAVPSTAPRTAVRKTLGADLLSGTPPRPPPLHY